MSTFYKVRLAWNVNVFLPHTSKSLDVINTLLAGDIREPIYVGSEHESERQGYCYIPAKEKVEVELVQDPWFADAEPPKKEPEA